MAYILYIEDDVDSVVLVQKVLESRGHELKWGFNGHEGLDLAMSRPDLILLDIRLPDISGYEVARQLRLSGHRVLKHVPIIALTAHLPDEEKHTCFEAGIDHILYKPLTTDDVKLPSIG